MEKENAVMATIAIVALILVACLVTWAATNYGWEKQAIASGNAHRVIVDGSAVFAWK